MSAQRPTWFPSRLDHSTRSRIARVLEASLRDDPSARELADLALSIPRDELVAATRFHGIGGYLHKRLAQTEVSDTPLMRELDAQRFGAVEGHLRVVNELPVLHDAFRAAACEWLIVKGPVLAGVHGRPDLRPYSDLDIVVPPRSFEEAVGALEHIGAQPAAVNWWHRAERLAGELPVRLSSGVVVDLHWHVVNEAAVRDAFDISMSELLSRARNVPIDGHEVATFDEVDTLLHAALHLSTSGGNRLIWLKDVERLLSSATIDWRVVEERAESMKLRLVVATTLDKVRSVMEIDENLAVVPTSRSERTWRAVAALARRVSPLARARGEGSLDRIVSRAARADFRSSAAELLRRSASWRPGAREPDLLAPRDFEHDGGDPAGREAFFAAIAEQQFWT